MIKIICTQCGEVFWSEFDDGDCPNQNCKKEEKELICYAVGAIGKTLYDKINSVGKKLIFKGTNTLPFKPKLDIRGGGKRFVIDIAIQCLDYLLDKGE